MRERTEISRVSARASMATIEKRSRRLARLDPLIGNLFYGNPDQRASSDTSANHRVCGTHVQEFVMAANHKRSRRSRTDRATSLICSTVIPFFSNLWEFL